jgi:hypothetical protein
MKYELYHISLRLRSEFDYLKMMDKYTAKLELIFKLFFAFSSGLHQAGF